MTLWSSGSVPYGDPKRTPDQSRVDKAFLLFPFFSFFPFSLFLSPLFPPFPPDLFRLFSGPACPPLTPFGALRTFRCVGCVRCTTIDGVRARVHVHVNYLHTYLQTYRYLNRKARKQEEEGGGGGPRHSGVRRLDV